MKMNTAFNHIDVPQDKPGWFYFSAQLLHDVRVTQSFHSIKHYKNSCPLISHILLIFKIYISKLTPFYSG